MNENYIEIKERCKDILIKGSASLAVMIASLFIALYPYINPAIDASHLPFHLIGGLLFAVSTAIFVYLIYKEFKPSNALVLNKHGFIDKKNVGENIEIEWTNVSSVKILGKNDTPFLGISLENSDIVIAKIKDKLADEIRENINEGLPSILISQADIRTPVKDLKDLFVKFVREARALQNDVPQKPKNNPFKTEDVLRAFGKLPDEPEKVPKAEEIVRTTVFEDTQSQNNDTSLPSDSFYQELKAKSQQEIFIENTVSEPETQQTENNIPTIDFSVEAKQNSEQQAEIPTEIQELLSKARSSKINELEKILNEKEVPYLIHNTASETDTESNDVVEESNNSSETLENTLSSDKNDELDSISLFFKNDSEDNVSRSESDADVLGQLEISLKETFSLNNEPEVISEQEVSEFTIPPSLESDDEDDLIIPDYD